MATINNSDQLRIRILELDLKMRDQEGQIKKDYGALKENLQPKNLMKNTFSYLAESPGIKRTIINTALGFFIGYASKKTVELFTPESINRTLEKLAQNQLDKWENKEPKNIISVGIALVRKFTPSDSPIYPFVKYGEQS